MLNALLGRKSPAEELRAHQRALNKAQRDLDREQKKLERQEQKVVMDIKRSAKAGQTNACKVMAKDLIRTRKQIQKFHQMKMQLQSASLRIQSMHSSQQMAQAMRGASKAMGTMNKNMNLPEIQNIMMAFQRESEVMSMKEETISETIDSVFEEEDEGDEQDAIINQVMDEIGIDILGPMASVPRTAIESPSTGSRERVAIAAGDVDADGEDAALQARLEILRRE